jgi:hypothetical protein
VKLQPTTTQYDVIEAGVYAAVIDSVTPEDPNPRFEDARPQLKFIFQVTDPDAADAKVFAWTGQTFGPKSKLRPWLASLIPDFDPDHDELDTDELVGKRCRIVVTLKKGEDNIERNRVGEVLPAEQRRRGQPAQPVQVQEPVPF